MFIGSHNGRSYAVKVNNVNDRYFQQIFGRQVDDLRKINLFKSTAKKVYVLAKGRSTTAAVREWVKLNKPSQFFATWQADSPFYKDDSVELWVA